MVRDTAAIGPDITVDTATPDPETTIEALLRAYNRMPLDTDLAANDLLQWDGTNLVKVDLSGASEGDLLEVQADGSVAPSNAASVVKIDEITVGAGGAATIDFTSIPQDYRHLKVEGQLRGTGASNSIAVDLQINGDTGSNYDEHYIELTGTTFNGVQTRGQTSARVGIAPGGNAAAGFAGPYLLNLPHYTGTTFYKAGTAESWLFRESGLGDMQVTQNRFGWLSTVAVSRLTFIGSFDFAEGSTLSLYGVQSAA